MYLGYFCYTMRGILMIFGLILSNLVFSQTNGHFLINGQYIMNNLVYPPTLTKVTKNNWHTGYMTLTDGGGKKLLHAPEDLVNVYGQKIPNQDSLWINKPYHTYMGGLVRLNDSLAGGFWHSSSNSKKEFTYYSVVDFKYNNGHGRMLPGNKTQLLNSGNVNAFKMCRSIDGAYLLVTHVDDTLYLFKVSEATILQTDKLYYPLYQYPDFKKFGVKLSLIKKSQGCQMIFSHSSDFLLFSKYQYAYIDYPLIDSIQEIFTNVEFSKIYIDKINSKFLPLRTEVVYRNVFLKDSIGGNSPNSGINMVWSISPDNNLIHCRKEYYQKNSITKNYEYLRGGLVLYDIGLRKILDSVEQKNSSWLMSYSCRNTLSLYEHIGINAQLYEFDPNSKSYASYKFIKSYDSIQLTANDFNHLYQYVKISPKVTYTCKAIVKLENLSDLSGGLTTFKWFIKTQNGKTDTVFGTEPTIEYTKNGIYAFKVLATSTANGGYSEYYYDTLVIDIPPKAHTDFKVNHQVICRFAEQKFNNLCSSGRINSMVKEKYTWYFGDGNVSNIKEPQHAYQNPGTYTVKLVYYNGFCPDSIEYSNYIQVPDAPTHGFNSDITSGCAPLKVNFTDTTKHEVSMKEFYFYDTKGWEVISQTRFSHHFDKAGQYWVVQRNSGIGGCVTRIDSILIKVSKGLTQKDSVFIHSVGFTRDSSEISIHGFSIDGAINYNLYERTNGSNWKLIMISNRPNFIYQLYKLPYEIQFKIVAKDSCGTECSAGNEANPAILTGKVLDGSNSVELNATPYVLHSGNKTTYELFSSYDDESMSERRFYTMNTGYLDRQFLQVDKLQKCYILKGISIGRWSDTSYSNLKCLTYPDNSFFPNSFSPNNDGVNDFFAPLGTGIKSLSLKIFNSYGQAIYNSEGRNVQWDGDFKNVNCPTGFYIYTAKLNMVSGRILNRTGSLLLIR